ncbi:MAG: hypothetical protein N0E54_17405 [Candidatus Thiodiazotropha taylori]|nr:hypothetical protein [Candidatus Thiodiazotropha endolucinida]MCW4230521.1 hypothetical protein [Candidatus Thiodiazotropha taylori]
MKFFIDLTLRLAIFTVIIIISLCLLSIFHFFLSPNTSMQSTNLVYFLPSTVIGGGVLIAYFTYLSSQEKRLEESSRHKSEVLLTSASNGFDRVLDLLRIYNNDSYNWSQAASILKSIASIRDGIKDDEYNDAYNIKELVFKRELTKILSLVLPGKGNVTIGLPPTFFYGIKEWNNWRPLGHDYLQDLHKAALLSGERQRAHSHSGWTIAPASVTSVIEINDIKEVYNFIAKGKDRDKKKEVWNGTAEAYWIKHGPIVFIRHFEKYGVYNQEVIKRDDLKPVYPKKPT